MAKEKILVTGAYGQIGLVLTEALREKYGRDAVLATDIREQEEAAGPVESLNVLDKKRLEKLIGDHRITQIYHLAAILSAKGEREPRLAWQINMDGLFNVLDAAVDLKVAKVFFPSSIAVFGHQTPKVRTPQLGPLYPETVYGISKVAAEFWCLYYFQNYGLDVRSVRYPGIIGYQSMPGGGTTDYAVDIFHKAVQGEAYYCFLKPDTRLPMMYMADAIRATLEVMEAPAHQISVRTSYNLAGMNFTPEELAAEISEHLPDFEVFYQPDYRQKIADTWTESIDDITARKDWHWHPEYDIAAMTKEMIEKLKIKYGVTV